MPARPGVVGRKSTLTPFPAGTFTWRAGNRVAGRAAIPAAPVHVDDPSALHVASADIVRTRCGPVSQASPRCWVGIFLLALFSSLASLRLPSPALPVRPVALFAPASARFVARTGVFVRTAAPSARTTALSGCTAALFVRTLALFSPSSALLAAAAALFSRRTRFLLASLLGLRFSGAKKSGPEGPDQSPTPEQHHVSPNAC